MIGKLYNYIDRQMLLKGGDVFYFFSRQVKINY